MSKFQYEYSESFNVLKNTQETLDHQYSTRDYVGALETLLFRAVRPLIVTSKFSDTFLAGVTAWYSCNAKRRISRLEKSEFFGLVAQMLATSDCELKFQKIQQMQLERTILYFMIDLWLQNLNGYTRSVATYAKTKEKSKRKDISAFEYRIGKRPNVELSLYSAIRESRFWLSQFLLLKQMILEKYSRMVISTAQRDYKAMGHKVNLNDLIQNYMMTTSRALDKCDYKQGTLTSYIQLWLKSARSRSLKTDLMESVESPSTKLLDNDEDEISNSIETCVEDDHSEKEHVQNVREIVKLVDPLGIFRLKHNIEESLSRNELQLLNSI